MENRGALRAKTCQVVLLTAFTLLTASGCGNPGGERAEVLFGKPMIRPFFIAAVWPAPGATVRRSSPEGWGWPSQYIIMEISPQGEVPVEGTAPDVGIICAEINIGGLLRPGDDWDYFEGPIEIGLDGQRLSDPSHDTTLELISTANGGRGPSSDKLCWETSARLGVHVVDLTVGTSTGEECTYSWAFRVTP